MAVEHLRAGSAHVTPAPGVQPAAPAFEAMRWLDAFTGIGGGYALMSGRKLCLTVEVCEADRLSDVMGQIAGNPDRLEQVKRAIEQRQCGETA